MALDWTAQQDYCRLVGSESEPGFQCLAGWVLRGFKVPKAALADLFAFPAPTGRCVCWAHAIAAGLRFSTAKGPGRGRPPHGSTAPFAPRLLFAPEGRPEGGPEGRPAGGPEGRPVG